MFGNLAGVAAEVPTVSREVQALVRVQAATVILEHVRVIDGTGKPAVADQNVVIEHGKIARIEAARDVAPAAGTTVLDLNGYSVMPGIVGMHDHLYYIATPNVSPGRVPAFDSPIIVPQMTFSAPRLYLAAA